MVKVEPGLGYDYPDFIKDPARAAINFGANLAYKSAERFVLDRLSGRNVTKGDPVDQSVPETKEVDQPTGYERATTYRTRRFSKFCRLGSRVANEAISNFLAAMAQERVVKCQWQYQLIVPKGSRASVAQVHRHMGALAGSGASGATNLPRSLGSTTLLADFGSGVSANTVNAKVGSIQTLYSPYNASFYEQISYGMGATSIGGLIGTANQSGPMVAVDLVADVNGVQNKDLGKNFLKIGDGLDSSVGAHTHVVSPFYMPDYFKDSNIDYTDQTTKKIFQRHTAGGVKINIMNMSEMPMNVDIVVFKCKSNAMGSDDALTGTPTDISLDTNMITATDTTTNALFLSQRFGDSGQSNYAIADQYNPVANILAANVQKFWNWRNYLRQATQKDGGNTDLPGASANAASFDFTTNVNPLADPNWKFLANYGVSSRVKSEAKAQEPTSQWGVEENYREVNRVRVSIPVTGSYEHNMSFGGMRYDVVDRINRSRNQKVAYMTEHGQVNCPAYRITDIRGETYVVFVSAAGAQQPGKNDSLGSYGVVTPGGVLAVRVEEYEIIQPYYGDIEKQKPVYTRGSIKPNASLTPLELVPITQHVKVVD